MSIELLKGTRVSRLLGLPVTDPRLLPNEHFVRLQETLALRDILPYAQQAYFGVLRYGHKLPYVSALRHLNIADGSERSSLEEFFNTVCIAHQILHPREEKPELQGIAALGVLRTSTNQEARQNAASVLIAHDPVAREIYEHNEALYTGDIIPIEAREIEELLALRPILGNDPEKWYTGQLPDHVKESFGDLLAQGHALEKDPTKKLSQLLNHHVAQFHVELWTNALED